MGVSQREPYRFPTTQWSAVEQAGDSGAGAAGALARLLPRYLAPLRAHLIQHKRLPSHQAEDLLQAFVAEQLLQRNLLAAAARERGRFRTFLLTALDRFVSNQSRDQQRLKRAPRQEHVPIEALADVPARGLTPSEVFEAAWARQVLANAAERMRDACDDAGRNDVWQVFDGRVLAPTLDGAEPVPYEQLVARLGLSDVHAASNLLVTAKRMFARSLRGVVGEYMGGGRQIDEEIAELREVLGRGRE